MVYGQVPSNPFCPVALYPRKLFKETLLGILKSWGNPGKWFKNLGGIGFVGINAIFVSE